MMLQLRALLIRIHIVRVPRSRESRSTLSFELDLDASNGSFSRQVEDDLAGEKVEISIVFVLALEQDRRRGGHDGGRPGYGGMAELWESMEEIARVIESNILV